MQTAEEKKRRQTKRRGNGEGSIFQRADGWWVATITVGRNSGGKRIRRTVYGETKKAVQDKLTDLHSKRSVGALRELKRMTVAQYLQHWLKTIEPPVVRISTHEGYRDVVEKQLEPHIGGLQIAALSSVHIEAMLSALKQAGASQRSLRMCYVVLRIAVGRAVKAKLLPFNPCADVDRPAVQKKDVEPFTTAQVRVLLKASGPRDDNAKDEEPGGFADGRYRALIVLAVTTGMRQGELFGLKWEDVDLDAGVLTVRRNLIEVKGKHHWGEPKSKTSRRRIALPPVAVNALRDHRKQMLAEGLLLKSQTVFCNTDGGLLGKSNFRRRVWVPLLDSAGLPHKRFHDLRHTAASMLCELGVHAKIIQSRLGHSDIGITMNTYGHLMEGMDEQAAGQIGSHLETRTA